ncbi:MAG: hypothetical protein JWO58_1015 [Chitinophagaceae bacterium]|jgi:hypothetical protein|nr:hypothetical protein [Chitinophagaceae bacterium]
MIHTNIVSEWVYEHYLFYLFLCIADCDCFISDEEIQEIKEEAFKHWPSESVSALYKNVHNEFISHSEEEKTKFISDNAAHFLRTPIVRKKAIQHLIKMVPSEHDDCEEYVMFRYIRKVINNLK